MTRALALLLIGLVFGGAAGFVVGSSDTAPEAAAPAMDHSAHAHVHGEGVMIEPGATAPQLEIELLPDPVAGWNLHLQTRNFRFAADRAGLEHMPGEGHAHIYVNGEKVARTYGDWFHLETLPTGPVEIEATLTSNDHRSLMVGEVPLSATVAFNNPG